MDYDKNVYHLVTIGNVTFTVENAQMVHYRNGDLIPNLKDSALWANAKTATDSGAWCYYNNTNNADSQKLYGKLYNWYAVNDVRGLAPQGFHVATTKDFDKLIANLDINIEGQELKSKHYWVSDADSAKPNRDKYGFAALPAGYRGGNFYFLGYYGYFWSSTEYVSNDAYYQYLSYDNARTGRSNVSKLLGFSVRFVRD